MSSHHAGLDAFRAGCDYFGRRSGLRRQFSLPRPKDWPYFALLGFLGITFHQWLQSTGLVTSQATTTGWIVASMPIFIAILGWLVLKEKLNWLQALGYFAGSLRGFAHRYPRQLECSCVRQIR